MPVSCPSYDGSLNMSSLNISLPLSAHCLVIRPSSAVYTAFCMVNVVILIPTCTYIFYVGFRQWQQQRSMSLASTMSNTDIVTFHMVIMELVGVLGFIFSSYEIYCNMDILILGLLFWTFSWLGEAFFHLLLCLERYVAVIHPITYLSLRAARGIRIRNISIGSVWLLCFVGTILIIENNIFVWLFLCTSIFTLIVISFCTCSVLYILIRPRPGQQGGNRGRMDQSKKKAFFTLITILVAVFLRCLINIIGAGLSGVVDLDVCFVQMLGIWFNVPCTLVIPFLYLHNARTFACCKHNS